MKDSDDLTPVASRKAQLITEWLQDHGVFGDDGVREELLEGAHKHAITILKLEFPDEKF